MALDEQLAPSLAALPGNVLAGRYLVEAIIGVGSMSVVFRAQHLSLERPVAIKALRPDHGPHVQERFKREAEMAARLDHPNCVRIYECASHDGLFFIVMALLEGVPLSSDIDRPRTLRQVCHLGLEMLEGLEHAHAQGVIHRDVNPRSLFVTQRADGSEHLTISDFGLAKVVHSETPGGATISGVRGRPAYMSPEQALGLKVDPRSDLYEAGIVLFRMLAGTLPFVDDDPAVQLRKQITQDLPQLPEWVPEPLAMFIYQLSDKERDRRFATAREAIADLRHVMRWLDSSKLADDVVTGSSEPEPEPEPETPADSYPGQVHADQPISEPDLEDATLQSFIAPQSPPGAGGSLRRSRVWLPLAGSVVLASGLGMWGVLQMRGEASESPTPTTQSEEPVVTAAKAEAGAKDSQRGVHLLASVNNRDRAVRLGYERRHRYLQELRGDPKLASLIDDRLNRLLDLVQADEASEPCRVFATALEQIAARPDTYYLEALKNAEPPSDPDDERCAGLAQRAEQLRAELGGEEPERVRKKKRRRKSRRRRSSRHNKKKTARKTQPADAEPEPWAAEKKSELKNPYE